MRIFPRGRDYQMAIDAAADASADLTFAVDAEAIDPAVFGLTAYAVSPARAPRIDRATAMQVPAVKRSRDIVCPTAGGLPLVLSAPTGQRLAWELFDQPEVNVPRSVTMARLFEDVLFEGVGWWRMTRENAYGFPGKVERLAPHRVRVDDNSRIYVDGAEVTGADRANLIRFDSPNDALLTAGARAIRTCLLLDMAAARHADGTPPLDYFTPNLNESGDPFAEDEEVIEALNTWHVRRQSGYTGYVPYALKYNVAGWSPDQLQMAEARQHAVLEIARCAGVDPEELGVSTTSRTYSNQWDRRKAFLDFNLRSYLNAVQDRLNMPDVTPEGFVSRFDLDDFLATDPKARFETYRLGLDVGVYADTNEVRAAEGKPALATPPAAPSRPALAAVQENAS